MKIGLQIPNFTWPGGPAELGARLAEIVATADEVGLASIWVMDHFFQIPFMGEVDQDMLEGYAALTFIAAHTRRARLGTLVTGVTYRHPGVLVKTASTLDVLSGGRAYLGIGAAWFDREHEGLGVPFPPLAERFERLEETLRIAKQMWSNEIGPFEGRHYRLAEPLCVPMPISQPHPPIMIGGLGERKTLRLVAQYADAWNAIDFVGLEELRRKRDVLRAHCDAVGRDFAQIECTTLGTLHLAPGEMTAADAIAFFRERAESGFPHVIVNLPNIADLKPIEILGREVLPEVSDF